MTISKFKDKLYNTPHLMTKESFDNLVEFLEQPVDAEMMSMLSNSNQAELNNSYNPDTGIGVIDVSGSLTYQTEWYQKYFGGVSYQSIKEQALQLSKQGMTTLLLRVDSGGGEGFQTFETGQYLQKLSSDYNFKIVAYVDGIAASAAYAIASCAHEVISNPQSEVGSIGCVVRLRNTNKAMMNAGVEDTYITFGDNKIPFDPKGEWRKEFKERVQAKVDTLGTEFTNYVATNRSMDVEAVKATQAATYLAKDALEIGLIDSVMTHEEFYTYLADFVQKEKKPQMLKHKLFTFNSEQEKIEMKELEVAQLELSTLKISMEADKVAKAALETEVATLKASLEETKTKITAFEAVAAQLEADKAAVVKAQADALAVSRKAVLSDALPADKVEEVYKALADVSETVFQFAVAGYKAQEESKSKDPLFKEVGGEGEVAAEAFDPAKAQAEYNKKHFNK